MIAHIVMFWLKDKDNQALVEETLDKLNGMAGKIPGLIRVRASRDGVNSPRSCHVCLSTLLESWEALDVYQAHPVHLAVKAHMSTVMERSASADFEVEE